MKTLWQRLNDCRLGHLAMRALPPTVGNILILESYWYAEYTALVARGIEVRKNTACANECFINLVLALTGLGNMPNGDIGGWHSYIANHGLSIE